MNLKFLAPLAIILLAFCSCDKGRDTGESSSEVSEDAARPASEVTSGGGGLKASPPADLPARPKPHFVNRANEFVTNWFKERGETNIVNVEAGIGVDGSGLRVRCLLDDYSTPVRSTDDYSLESQFIITLDDGREVVEFFKSRGESFDEAGDQALADFADGMLQVFYKGFVNPEDSHLEPTTITIGGVQRSLFSGKMIVSSKLSTGGFSLSDRMGTVLADLTLDESTHWVRVRYLRSGDQDPTTSVKVDNAISSILSERVESLDWPETEGLLACKQYLIIK